MLGHVGRKQLPDLLGNRRENLFRRRPARHQRRDPPQRRLLLGQPGQGGAALGVRDRRRHQFGERGQARLGVRRQLLQGRAGGDHAPQAAVNDDRRPGRRAEARPRAMTAPIGPRGAIGIAVDPGRPAGLRRPAGRGSSAERPPAADRESGRPACPTATKVSTRRRTVAAHARQIDRKQPPDLLGDRREHLLRRPPARHQRRDPAQRGLLFGQLTQPGPIGWIIIRPPAGGPGAAI